MSEGPSRFFIGGILRIITAEDLRSHFSSFGTLAECRIQTNSAKQSLGYGWISFTRPVPNLLEQQHIVRGSRLNVEVAKGETRNSQNQNLPSSNVNAAPLRVIGGGGIGSGDHNFNNNSNNRPSPVVLGPGGTMVTTPLGMSAAPPPPAYGTDSSNRRSRRRSRSSSSRRSYSSRSSSSRSDEDSSSERVHRRRHRRRSSPPHHRHAAVVLPAAPNPNIVGVVAPLPSSSAAATSSSTAPSHHHQPPPTPPQRGGYNSGKQQQQQQPMYPSLPQPSGPPATAGGAAGASAGVTMICVPYAICPPEMVRDPRACIGQYFAERQVVQVTSPPLM